MSGTLYVVATPIGNLEDITLRALRVLREVHVIAAEDTRRTARLLAHHGIATPTLSFHEHNTRLRVPQLVGRLAAGESIALVTDAGTPGVSDPGTELVSACVQRHLPVEPVPGPSAPVTAAIVSGFPLEPLTIFGFPPFRSRDRATWLARIAEIPHTVTFFEAPHRMSSTMSLAAELLGDRPIVVAREISKIHQEFLRGPANGVLFGEMTEWRGELTVVVGPAVARVAGPAIVSDREMLGEFGRLAEMAGVSRREAVTETARKYGRSPREVYAAIERAKKSVE